MANALPLLLIGGAVVLIMGGKKKSRHVGAEPGEGVVDLRKAVEEGVFPAGERWMIVEMQYKFWPSDPPKTVYAIAIDLAMDGNFVTLKRRGALMYSENMGEARMLIKLISDGTTTLDEKGNASDPGGW